MVMPQKMGYLGGNVLYLIGWALTLLGLALVQNECDDRQEAGFFTGASFTSVPFFTSPLGEDCKKGFRFFWFIWALDTIPPLLAVVAAVKPDLARGVSTSFFAVIAPLNILMANSFYNAFDPQVFGLTEHMERFMKVTMAGFCILSGAALLMLMADGLLAHGHNSGQPNTVKVQVVEKTAAGHTTLEV